MAYDNLLERKRASLVAVLGAIDPAISTMDLWDRYLTASGFPGPRSVLDRMASAAAASGQTLIQYVYGVGSLGPELAPAIDDPIWLLTGTPQPTQDAGGIHFVGASGGSAATYTNDGLFPNDVMFRIAFSIRNYSGAGIGRVLVYGDTANHLASTTAAGIPGNSNGDFVAFRATSSTGANNDEIRIQCQTGLCTFDITAVSVRRVL